MFCHATVGKSSIDMDSLSLVPRPEVRIASFSALLLLFHAASEIQAGHLVQLPGRYDFIRTVDF